MIAQAQSPEPVTALALALLRAEMEALASVLPGLWSFAPSHEAIGEEATDEAAEAAFDNMPV